ncbi:MAG: tRNA-dihydrouridine synthase family protein [Erysipelotrichaceae bacterium]|nr:tRNA-dihydrouridine synthase family protein [Erysipelotrichaceae bacterium]
MWKIGNVKINGPVVLAPMAGFTSFGYRKFMKDFGVDVAVTEMISDCGLIYDNEQTIAYLKSDKSEKPLGIQLFGSDTDNLIKALQIVVKKASDFDFIDINLGCPVPKVTKSGAGSALLKDPKKIGHLFKELVSNSPVPITAKIRLGWDDDHINFMEVIEELENSGVSMIAVHARTTKQLYSGKPKWELLKDLGNKMSVPLVVSGDIYTLDDAINAMELTKAKGVMVARGGIGNPQLIRQISTYFKTGQRLPDATLDEQIKYSLQLAKMMIEDKGEISAMKIYRTIGPRFFFNFPNCKTIRTAIATTITTYKDLESIVNSAKDDISLDK